MKCKQSIFPNPFDTMPFRLVNIILWLEAKRSSYAGSFIEKAGQLQRQRR